MLQNLHRRFVLCVASQIYSQDFANFVTFSEYINFTKSDKMGHVLAVPGQAIQKSNLHINGQIDPKPAIVIC